MTCTYGAIPCLDPAQEAANCRLLGYPTPWAGAANAFTCPQGQDYGRGRVLMFRGDILSLNLNTLYPLVFSDGTRTVTLKQVLFVRAYCATPGGRGDPTEAYWVELADKRYLCHQPIDKAYNIRSAPGGAYYSATMNGGVAWTWAGMVGDIWSAVGRLGAFPGLPFAPNGTPEGWSFWGGDAFDSLGLVLDRLGCALDYNPVADTFSIVRLGVADLHAAAALTAVDPACVWDSDPLEGVRARIPARVRVFFASQRAAKDATGGSPFYAVDQTDPTPGGPLPGTDAGNVDAIYDDLPAIYDGTGSLTNAAALTARAQERAADYYRRMRQTRLYRSYTGGYSAPGLLPGSTLTAIIWRDTGSGLFTEVVRLPGPLLGDPFAGMAGDGPAGGTLDGGPPEAGPPGGGGPVPPPGGPPGHGGPIFGGPILYYPPPIYGGPILYGYPPVYGGPPAGSTPPGSLVVQNLDGTSPTFPCQLFNANNDVTNGLLKWVDQGGGAGYLSWMGLQLYKAGTGLKGPRTILELQDDTGILTTISDDPTSSRVVLKIKATGTGGTTSLSGSDVHLCGSTYDRRYFAGQGWLVAGSPSNQPFVAGRLYAIPWLFGGGGSSIDRFGIKVNGAGTVGTSKARWGIYSNTSASNPYPASLLVDSGDFDMGTNGIKEAAISQGITAGTLYWFAYLQNDALPFISGWAGSAQGTYGILGADNSYNAAQMGGWYKDSVTYGALPGTFPVGASVLETSGSAINFPLIGMRLQ